MTGNIKENLWNAINCLWALCVALFWFAMRVIWSGISKVISEALGEKEPSEFMLDLPLYISILLWAVLAFAVIALVLIRNKKWAKITLTAILGVFTVASAVVVVVGAIDYMYFILPKFFLSLGVSLCLVAFALLVFFPPKQNTRLLLSIKCTLVTLVIALTVFLSYGISFGSKFTHNVFLSSFSQKWFK